MRSLKTGLMIAFVSSLPFMAYAKTTEYVSAPFLGDTSEPEKKALTVTFSEGETGNTLSVEQGKNKEASVTVNLEKAETSANSFPLYYGVSDAGQIFTLQSRTPAGLLTISNGENGKTKSFFLVEQGTPIPSLPLYIQPPISGKTKSVSTLSFIDSYPFWNADSVSLGYSLMPVSHRVFLRGFPYLRADIANKICGAKRTSSGLFDLMEEQKLDCTTLMKRMQSLQTSTKWLGFKKTVASEASQLKDIVECSQGMKHPKACENIQSLIGQKDKITKTLLDVTAVR